MSTYAIVLTGTAFADLIISMKDDDDENKKKNVPIEFSLLCMFVICIFVLVITVWTYFEVSWFISIPSSILGAFIALLTWWVANADNKKLADKDIEPDNFTGGKVGDISGSTTGITLS